MDAEDSPQKMSEAFTAHSHGSKDLMEPYRCSSPMVQRKGQRESSRSGALPNKVKKKYSFFVGYFKISLSSNTAKANQRNRFENGVTSKP